MATISSKTEFKRPKNQVSFARDFDMVEMPDGTIYQARTAKGGRRSLHRIDCATGRDLGPANVTLRDIIEGGATFYR